MHKKGFTLVELLVSIALISIISGISLANYSDIRTSAQMESDVNTVVIALRDAQSKALSPDKTEFGITGKLCSIGVELDTNVTPNRILPYVVEDVSFSQDCSGGTRVYYASATELEKSNLIITDQYQIQFATPFGQTTIIPSSTSDLVTVGLQSLNGSISRSIDVYSSGLIDVQ